MQFLLFVIWITGCLIAGCAFEARKEKRAAKARGTK